LHPLKLISLSGFLSPYKPRPNISTIRSSFLNTILAFPSAPPDPNAKTPITWRHEKIWHSYPVLNPRITFENIQLDNKGKVFYTGGIESFISTMETSSLMGMNVARLIVDGWVDEDDAGIGKDDDRGEVVDGEHRDVISEL